MKVSINFITISLYFCFYISVIINRYHSKGFSSILFKSSILVQVALYFTNSFSSFIQKDIDLLSHSLTLNVLTYPLILCIIKTNGFIILSIFFPVKCLELVFVSINFEIAVLSPLTSQFFIGFFAA